MAKLQLRRGPWATIPQMEKAEIGEILDRKKLVTSVDGINNVILSPLQKWIPDTLYIADEDLVIQNGLIFQCSVEHTSSPAFDTDAAKWTLVSKPGTRVVVDIPARDAIAGYNLFEGLLCYVVDASADVTVTSGAAAYVYGDVGSGPTWTKIAEFESLDLVIEDATEIAKGIAMLATTLDVSTGADHNKIVTSLKLREVTGDKATLTTTATNLVGAINEHDIEIGDISTLNESSANLVTEINLKANELDVSARLDTKLSLVESGNREDLYLFDAGALAYSATDIMETGTLIAHAGAPAAGAAFDNLSTTTVWVSTSAGALNTGEWIGKVYDSSVNARKFSFVFKNRINGGSNQGPKSFKMQGLNVLGDFANDASWEDIIPTGINITSLAANTTDIVLATEIVNLQFVTSITTALENNIFDIFIPNAGYFGYRLVLLDHGLTSYTDGQGIAEISAFEVASLPDPATTFVSSINDLRAKIGDKDLLNESSPDLVTEVNLKANLVDLNALLTIAEAGDRSTLAGYDPLLVGIGSDLLIGGTASDPVIIDGNPASGVQKGTNGNFSTVSFAGAPAPINKVALDINLYAGGQSFKFQGKTSPTLDTWEDLLPDAVYIIATTSPAPTFTIGGAIILLGNHSSHTDFDLEITFPSTSLYYGIKLVTVNGQYGVHTVVYQEIKAYSYDGLVSPAITFASAINEVTQRVDLLGQPGDVTIESAIPANAAVLTYGPNVITTGNSGLAADIVDGVDSNIAYTDITAGSRRMITFAGPTAIRKVAVKSWHTAGSQQGPVKIQYSDNGSTWFDAGTQINVLSTLQEYEFDNNGAHTFWSILSVDTDSILLSYFQAFEGLTFSASRFLQVKENSLEAKHILSLNGIADKMIARTDANVAVTVLATDQLVRLSATTAGASQTVTLPLISSVFNGKLLTILGLGTNTYPALINAGVGNTIIGGSITINESGQAVTLVANLVTSQWEVVAHVKPSVIGAIFVKDNFLGTTAPTITNDSSEGYAKGSTWMDTTSSPAESYKCASASVGAAVWIKTSLTYDELPSSRAVIAHASGSGNTTFATSSKLLVITMASTDNVQVTLNASASYVDLIKIKRLGTGTGVISILPNGAETIDGVAGLLDTTPFLGTAGDLLSLEPTTSGFIIA